MMIYNINYVFASRQPSAPRLLCRVSGSFVLILFTFCFSKKCHCSCVQRLYTYVVQRVFYGGKNQRDKKKMFFCFFFYFFLYQRSSYPETWTVFEWCSCYRARRLNQNAKGRATPPRIAEALDR